MIFRKKKLKALRSELLMKLMQQKKVLVAFVPKKCQQAKALS
jgi:hypothetical protein